MSTWVTIIAEDLRDYLVAAQVTALRTVALGTGQTDPFDRVTEDVVARIRAEIQACPRNRVSVTPFTIPPDLKSYACHLIIEAMQTRIPRFELSDSQKKQADEARAYLRRIAECKIPVEMPDDPVSAPTVQSSSGISVVSAPGLTTGRTKLAGF